MDYRISQQIQTVLEQGEGDRRDVIVRVASPDDTKKSLLSLAAEALELRNMTLTARDVLPPSLDKLREPEPSGRPSRAPAAVAQAQEEIESLASKIASSDMPPDTTAKLKASGNKHLSPLLNSDLVQKAIAESVSREGQSAQEKAQTFWTSKAMRLNISTEDLQRLPEAVPEVQDIYPNRSLRVPRLLEVKNLPAAVQENKASSWGIHKVGALATWGAYGVRGKGVKVGVLDTGVDANHPDLQDRIAGWAEFDADGVLVNGSQPHDSDQHGTHCAGIIAGSNSSGQWIGVAPEAKLVVALVLDGRRGGTDAQVLAGIDWLVEQKVDVISMSLGGLSLDPEMPSTYTEAILTCLRAGIPVVTAIGNDGSQTTGSPGNDLFAFSVGATDYRDWPAGFSGGRTHIIRRSSLIPPEYLPLPYLKPDVSAPGVAIASSIPNGKWASFNGTSMATPHVAGAIALLLSATSISRNVAANKRAFLIQDLLTGSVEELGEAGQNNRVGFGRIDVLRAIAFAKERGY